MREKIVPIASLLIGILAFALTYQFLRGQMEQLRRKEQALYEGARKMYVVAAAHDIPEGTVIARRDVGKASIYASAATERMIMPEEAEMILGRKTLFSVKANRPLLWSDVEGGAGAGRGLANTVTPGMRAISLTAAGAAAVSCMVRPNDRVDVLGTFTFTAKDGSGEMESVTLTVLQDVTVLATGQEMANASLQRRSRAGQSSYSLVTLEVTPREAEVLVFAQQLKGRLTLSLRNPADVSFERDLPEVDFRHIEEKLPELNLERQRLIRHKRDL